VKHITVELEAKIRGSLEDAQARCESMFKERLRQADLHGEDLPDPMSPSEAEMVGWSRALKWVLEEGNCK
jgi:hypothetical protein